MPKQKKDGGGEKQSLGIYCGSMPKLQRDYIENCALQFFDSGVTEQEFKSSTGLSIRGMQALLPMKEEKELLHN